MITRPNFHLPIIMPKNHKPIISNVGLTRGLLNSLNIDGKVSYKMIYMLQKDIDPVDFKVGQTVLDVPDLDSIIKMIYNYNNKKPLFDGIETYITLKDIIKDIDDCYDKKLDYTCVLLSVFRPYFLLNLYIGLLIKRNNPNIDIMIGGPHIILSESIRKILHHVNIFEYIMSGDIIPILKKYLASELSPFTEYAPIYGNDFVMPIYYPIELSIFKFMLIKTSRSCPNICSFCPGHVEPFHVVDIKDVISVFEHYNRIIYDNHKTRSFFSVYFNDNTVNFSKKRIMQLTDGLIGIKNKIPIAESYFVFNNLNNDIIKALKMSKFETIFLGLDSFHEDKAELLTQTQHKRHNFLDIIDMFYKTELRILVSFIYGCPGETREHFDYDFEQIKKIKQKYCDSTLFDTRAYPYNHHVNSPMFNEPEKYGITYEYWKEFDYCDSEMNDIVTSIKQYYQCNVSVDEYIYRYLKFSNFCECDKYPTCDNYIERMGYRIEEKLNV